MRIYLIYLGAALAAAAGVGASVAFANGGGPPERFTICHAAGQEGTTHFVTLEDLPFPAVFGPAGHFFENGTPRAGHEQDYMGPCEGDETTPTETTPTETTPTTPTDTTPTTPTSTTPTTPSGPRCPPGMIPTAGKDGQPGNDECESPKTPTTPTTTTATPASPPPTVASTTTPSAPVTATPSKPQTKTSSTRATQTKQATLRKQPKGAPKPKPKNKPCPPGTRAFEGKCHAVVMGSG